MRRPAFSLIIIALLLSSWPALAASPQLSYRKLIAGRYGLKVTGMLCHACARAITAELGRMKNVASAKADFEAEEVVLDIPLGKTVSVSGLRRVLRRAAKKIDLDTQFEITDIRYLP